MMGLFHLNIVSESLVKSWCTHCVPAQNECSALGVFNMKLLWITTGTPQISKSKIKITTGTPFQEKSKKVVYPSWLRENGQLLRWMGNYCVPVGIGQLLLKCTSTRHRLYLAERFLEFAQVVTAAWFGPRPARVTAGSQKKAPRPAFLAISPFAALAPIRQ